MRIMMIYASESKKFDSLTERIFATFQSGGHQIEKIKAERGARVPSLFPYDLVLVGSPVEGFWGGKFSEELNELLRKCTGFQGKKSAVFVYPKLLGTGKATRRLMHRLEEKGSIVIYFGRVKSRSEAQNFAEKLGKKES